MQQTTLSTPRKRVLFVFFVWSVDERDVFSSAEQRAPVWLGAAQPQKRATLPISA